MKILVFGSLNYDNIYRTEHFVCPKETQTADSYSRGFGGKGCNQAIALAKAGLPVFFAGQVGFDGDPFRRYLQENGIHTDDLKQDASEATGHAIIEISGGQNRILLYGGANRTVSREQVDRTLEHFEPGDVLVLQNEISEIPYILRRAKERGLRTFLNAAPADRTLDLESLALADILCVNEVEGQFLAGTAAADPEPVLCALQEKYPETQILLTAGEQGSYYRFREQTVHVPAVRVNAVDTTGAGDTYSGFFLAGLCRGESVEDAMRLGAAAAAIEVQTVGAADAMPTLEEA